MASLQTSTGSIATILHLLYDDLFLPKPVCDIICEYKSAYTYEHFVCMLDIPSGELGDGAEHAKYPGAPKYYKPHVTKFRQAPVSSSAPVPAPNSLLVSDRKSDISSDDDRIHFWCWKDRTFTSFRCNDKKIMRSQKYEKIFCHPDGCLITTPSNKMYLTENYFIEIYDFDGAVLRNCYTRSGFSRGNPKYMAMSSDYDKLFLSDRKDVYMYSILETGYLGNVSLVTTVPIRSIPSPLFHKLASESVVHVNSDEILPPSLPLSFHENMLYILDAVKCRALVYDVSTLKFVTSWHLLDFKNALILRALDITVHKNHVYILTESGIHIFDVDGQYMCEWQKPENIIGRPQSIVFSDNEAYITFVNGQSGSVNTGTFVAVFS